MSEKYDFAFLHGGAQGSWVWRETIDALHRQDEGDIGNVLALDVPGCGVKRERDITSLSMEDIARELTADLERAGHRSTVLVGHSQGGQMMTIMAALKPGLFRRLVYVSCSLPLPGQTVLQMMGTSLHGTDENEVGWPCDPKFTATRERLRFMLGNDMGKKQEVEFYRRLGKDNWPASSYTFTDWKTEHLADIRSTYVMCLKDGILPLSWQEKFAQRFRVQREVRVDSGHQAMATRPHALAEIVRLEAKD